jgi:hypothetical protein
LWVIGWIETVNDQLKNISQIEHTRHRSLTGFMLNLLGGLVAYTYQDKKPSLRDCLKTNWLIVVAIFLAISAKIARKRTPTSIRV